MPSRINMLLKYSSRFKKDLKAYKHDKPVLNDLEEVLDLLLEGKSLPAKNRNHRLSGEFSDCFECHIRPDVILIYKYHENILHILLLRIGSHSRIFGK